jgi:hypothetical protein
MFPIALTRASRCACLPLRADEWLPSSFFIQRLRVAQWSVLRREQHLLSFSVGLSRSSFFSLPPCSQTRSAIVNVSGYSRVSKTDGHVSRC